MNFSDLGLSDKTIKAINEFGIRKPTTIQADVIPSILQGRDVFTIAPQKCGKTFSYVFPLIDIISNHNKQNILIITPSSEESVVVSDRLSIFNKYHEINEATIKDGDEDFDNEANVIIGSPDLLLEIVEEGRIVLSNINLLVVDDINLIKKNKQLENLKKILDLLPADKQNVVYTNRRSKDTQEILDRILQAPEEIKVDKEKELEAEIVEAETMQVKEKKDNRRPERNARPEKPKRQYEEGQKNGQNKFQHNIVDEEAINLSKRYNSFGGNTPKFILSKCVIVENE